MGPFGAVGSLAGWELRRLARRGQVVRARLAVLYALLLAFVTFAGYWFAPLPVRELFFAQPPTLSIAECAAFAESLALALFMAQLVAVVALTPALAASAVAEEKDQQTLPLLLTTLLSDREIVFGKAAGRVAFVLAAVFAGAPVFAITLLFGGVSAGVLAAGFALTAGTVVLCAAIGVHAACRTPDLRAAVLRAYGCVALVVCGGFVPPFAYLSPFAVLAAVTRGSPADFPFYAAAVGYPLLQLLVAAAYLASAARSLRLRGATAGPPPVTAYPEPPRRADPMLLQPEHDAPRDLPPLDPADPVLWKERCVGWRPDWALPTASKVAGAFAALAAAALLVGGAWALFAHLARNFDPAEAVRLSPRSGTPLTGGWLLMCAGVCAAGRYLLPLAVGLSGAVAGERARGTLDALLATPLDRRAMLRAKVRAHAERGTGFATTAVIAVGTAFVVDGGARVGAVAAALAAAGTALVIALGAWLTVRCASDVRAFRLLLPAAVLAVGWPLGAWGLMRAELAIPPDALVRAFGAAACGCAIAAAVLWRLAGSKLESGE